jgi:hypothetical protein
MNQPWHGDDRDDRERPGADMALLLSAPLGAAAAPTPHVALATPEVEDEFARKDCREWTSRKRERCSRFSPCMGPRPSSTAHG